MLGAARRGAAIFETPPVTRLKRLSGNRYEVGTARGTIVAEAVREGALLRLRPKAMTVAVILAGLLPILFTGGAGAEVMRRIAAPMVGGMVSATALTLIVIPAIYAFLAEARLARAAGGS